MAHLDEIVARKRKIAAGYRDLLQSVPEVAWMPEAAYGVSNRWLSVMVLDERQTRTTPEHVRLALEAENIESRPVWKPMHEQPVFAEARCHGGAVASRLFKQGLCLPSGAGLTPQELERIAGIVRKTVQTV